jgi:hypothetical protein
LPDVPLEIPFRIPPSLIERAFPAEAIDMALEAEILVLCQIQSDRSVVCRIAEFAETNPEKLAILQRVYTASVLKAVHSAKICPDGCAIAPPVGAVFKIDLKFKFGG